MKYGNLCYTHLVNAAPLGGFITSNKLSGFSALLSLALLGLTLLHSGAGIDITDEGFYLNAISRPWDQGPAIRLFGFFYYPFYELAGGDIAFFRQVHIVCLYGVCVVMFWSILTNAHTPQANEMPYVLSLSLVLATSVLFYFQYWLPTPSYNSLVFFGHMLSIVSLLKISKAGEKQQKFYYWALLGFSGWVTFMAKPTSTLSVAVLVAAYLFVNKKWLWRGIGQATAVAFSLLFLTSLVIAGSPVAFVEYLLLAVEQEKRCCYNGIAGSFRLDPFIPYVGFVEKSVYSASIIAFVVMCAFISVLNHRAAKILFTAIYVTLLLLSGSLFINTSMAPTWLWALKIEYLLLLPFILPVWLFIKSCSIENVRNLMNALLFALFAFSCSFGTNNNYNFHVSWFSTFIIFSLVYTSFVHNAKRQRFIELLSAAVLLLAALTVTGSINHPYRQEAPLAQQKNRISAFGATSSLRVDDTAYNYLHSLQSMAKNAGFNATHTVLDLTGGAPIAAYMLGAKPAVRAWVSCGGTGEECVRFFLQETPCADIASAWVLFSQPQTSYVNYDILLDHGVQWQRDLQPVGQTTVVPVIKDIHVLYKPTRPYHEAVAACEAARAKTKN